MAGIEDHKLYNNSGPVPPDGFDIWPALTTHAKSPRNSIVHEFDETQKIFAIRSGQWKLIWGKVGVSDWIQDVSYDTGCTPLLPPQALGFESDSQSALPSQQLLVHQSRPTGLSCTEQAPCLFNVIQDPEERHNQVCIPFLIC